MTNQISIILRRTYKPLSYLWWRKCMISTLSSLGERRLCWTGKRPRRGGRPSWRSIRWGKTGLGIWKRRKPRAYRSWAKITLVADQVGPFLDSRPPPFRRVNTDFLGFQLKAIASLRSQWHKRRRNDFIKIQTLGQIMNQLLDFLPYADNSSRITCRRVSSSGCSGSSSFCFSVPRYWFSNIRSQIFLSETGYLNPVLFWRKR